jgi:hypothetical protein
MTGMLSASLACQRTVTMESARQPAPGELAARSGLAALPAAPSRARRNVQASLARWRTGPEAVKTAQVLAAELVTSAVRFAGDPSGLLTSTGPPGRPVLFRAGVGRKRARSSQGER